MSAERLEVLAETYRTVSRMFVGAQQSPAMAAHAAAALLIERAAVAIRAADQSCATLEWVGVDFAPPADMLAVYQPGLGTVAVMAADELVIFDEVETEALHAALGEALAARALGRSLTAEAGEWQR